MNRRQMLAGCLVFPLLNKLFKREPKLADPVPPGFIEVARFQDGKKYHVIFRKECRWRWYTNGKFHELAGENE